MKDKKLSLFFGRVKKLKTLSRTKKLKTSSRKKKKKKKKKKKLTRRRIERSGVVVGHRS